MGAVVVAGRYAPRPPLDQDWVRKSLGPSLLLELASNLPFRPRRWNNDYSEGGFWVNKTQNIPSPFLPVVSTPFVNTRWLNQDDPAVWYQQTPQSFDTLSQTLQLYAPSQMKILPVAETPDWSFNRQRNSLILSVASAPFVPSFWKYNDDASGTWQIKPVSLSVTNLPIGGGYPFKPPYWKNNDDTSVWYGGPRNVNRVIDLAFVTPLTPSRWKFDYDDKSSWSGAPENIPLAYLPVQAPFVARYWKQDYNDDKSLWIVSSFSKPIVQGLTNGGFPIKPPYWKYDEDLPGYWVGTPTDVPSVQGLVIVTPLTPSQWNNDYNELPVWTVVSLPSNLLTGLPPPPLPILPQSSGIQRSEWQKGYERLLQQQKEKRVDVKESAAVLGRYGGLQRAKSLTSNQRSAIASLAAKTRWK